MNQALVSVIIPTHNRVAFLMEAIDSALKQDYANIEVIIVDDGSIDGTQAAVRSLGHPKVHYHYISNQGPAAARNAGIRLAKGTYIAFLDSDDLWCGDKLNKQVRYFEDHPGTGMVASNFRYVDVAKNVVCEPAKPFGYTVGRNFITDILEINFPMATPTIVVKRTVLASVGLFNERLPISEDLDLWVRIGLVFDVGYIDEVLASVRLHAHHLMRQTPRYQVWLDSVRVLEAHRLRILERVANVDRHFARFYALAGNIALLAGLRKKAFFIYLQAMLRAPWKLSSHKDLVRCFLPLAYLRKRYERSVAASKAHPTMHLYR